MLLELLRAAAFLVAVFFAFTYMNCVFWETVQHNTRHPDDKGMVQLDKGWTCTKNVWTDYASWVGYDVSKVPE